MFYSVQAALLSKGLKYSSHAAVVAHFGQHFIKSNLLPKKLGKALAKAFRSRMVSDKEFPARYLTLDDATVLSLLAARATSLLNMPSPLASLGLPQSTLKQYMALLETAFLVQPLPA